MGGSKPETDQRNAAMLRDRRSGMSVEQLAERYELTPRYVRKLLVRLSGDSLIEPGSLTYGWMSNPAAFARPGPPCPQPVQPGPIRFTCRDCGSDVSTRTWNCTGCNTHFSFFPGRTRDESRSKDGDRTQAEVVRVP